MGHKLDFVLEDFTRVQWAPEARDVWEPRFQEVSNSWQLMELHLVSLGFKPSALLVVSPEQLTVIFRKATLLGLAVLVLARQRENGSYAATTAPYVEGKPFNYRVAICKDHLASRWFPAWDAHDDMEIGALLGYPECCREFFKKVWVDWDHIDTTWHQACNTNRVDSGSVINVYPDPACNVTLRYLGLRWVSHLPCSFKCEPTIAMVVDYIDVLKQQFPRECRTLSEALQWPVKWTALHGIAEITTPVCKIISRTDATGSKLEVRQNGPLYPDEGAQGIDFPFRTKSAMHRARLITNDRWSLNGFTSYESMVQAHNTVISAAGDLRGKSVIDLGCGTGELLQVYKGIAAELHGIDTNATALAKAKKFVNVREMNIFEPEVFNRKFDVAFISTQRFVESEEWAQLLERLRRFTKETIFYSYGDFTGWSVIGEKPSITVGPNTALKVVW
jgi:SAM-dependent methyltransferase